MQVGVGFQCFNLGGSMKGVGGRRVKVDQLSAALVGFLVVLSIRS